MALGEKKYQRLHSHNVKRRWKITTIAESLSWFPEFCISRNATSSKSGSRCGKVIKDSKTEKMAESQREASLLTVHGRVLWELLPAFTKPNVYKTTDKRNSEDCAFVPY